jgi:hypothetical protein
MTLGGILNGLGKHLKGLPIWPNKTKRELYKAAEMYRTALNYPGSKKGAEFFKTYCPLDAHRLKSYKSTGIPALLTVAIINQSTGEGWGNIEALGEKLTTQQKIKLNELAKSNKFQTLKQRAVLFDQLGQRHEDLEELVDGACALDKSRIATLVDISDENVKPLEFCINATDAQISILGTIDKSRRTPASLFLRHIPDILLPQAKFVIESLEYKRHMYDFFGIAPEKTVEALATLDQKTKKEYCTNMDPTTAGVILRAFGGLPSKEYNTLMAEVGEKSLCVLSGAMEEHIKLFAENFCGFTKQKRKKIIEELYSVPLHRRHYVINLANSYGYNSSTYRAGMEMDDIRVASLMKQNILDNKILTARIMELPGESREAYIRFTEWLGTDKMEQMSVDDFTSANQAYQFALADDDQQKFCQGLQGAVAKNNLKNWSKAVVAYHQKGVIGGDQYKRRDVIAA